MADNNQEGLETKVVSVSFPSSDLVRLQERGRELGLTEGEVIKTALNYLYDTCDIRKKGEQFIALVDTDSKEAPYVQAFEPKPVLKAYGPVLLTVRVSDILG